MVKITNYKLQNRGYTLIEVMTVIAIISIMSGIFLANQSFGKQSISLKQATSQLISDLRMAQGMAMNVTQFKKTDGTKEVPRGGYGILVGGVPAASYTIYADLNGNNDMNAGEGYLTRSLPSGITISAKTVSDINFIPPDPKVCFDDLSPISSPVCVGGSTAAYLATITLRYGGSGGPTKSVSINGITGQIMED